jgi:hypothetical protein
MALLTRIRVRFLALLKKARVRLVQNFYRFSSYRISIAFARTGFLSVDRARVHARAVARASARLRARRRAAMRARAALRGRMVGRAARPARGQLGQCRPAARPARPAQAKKKRLGVNLSAGEKAPRSAGDGRVEPLNYSLKIAASAASITSTIRPISIRPPYRRLRRLRRSDRAPAW